MNNHALAQVGRGPQPSRSRTNSTCIDLAPVDLAMGEAHADALEAAALGDPLRSFVLGLGKDRRRVNPRS